MIDKTIQSFGTWCKTKKLLMLNVPIKRERRNVNGKISNIRLRKVFVLKRRYLDNLVKGIVSYIADYQSHIKNLKKEMFSIVGYVRKSPGSENESTRIKLLQRMVDCLINRSLVEKVFVSCRCSASEQLFRVIQMMQKSLLN
ncbi:hypothetical protein BDF20DRAFT_20949 [Mycotypha africana]|uniref:uncharacterized protein n=1 Tax=Mycotypha africana TaxID=64632 RepID=UPI00230049CF|nr:uncharacterized protein BDF20DRAFT_20949 [Mycotypha africana]KAI8991073.1 hypothetical protein BDF20DRAFT_20949 [Mycotypha africana]